MDEYRKIKENFYFGRYEPTELDAGKFCELVYRILEFASTNTFTSLGTIIRNLGEKFRAMENQTSLPDSFRLHIPRVANALYNIRNNRGVGHVSGDVNPNLPDSMLVATGADWILAELVRKYYQCPFDVAQGIVNRLVQRKLPLIYEVAGKRRVLNPTLSSSEQVLALLTAEFPGSLRDSTLFEWVGHSNLTVFKREVLTPLHEKRLVEYSDSMCAALPTAVRIVEDNYLSWMSFDPQSLLDESKRRRK